LLFSLLYHNFKGRSQNLQYPDGQLHNQADTGRLARLNCNHQLATLGNKVFLYPYNGESTLPFRSFIRRQAQYNNLRTVEEFTVTEKVCVKIVNADCSIAFNFVHSLLEIVLAAGRMHYLRDPVTAYVAEIHDSVSALAFSAGLFVLPDLHIDDHVAWLQKGAHAVQLGLLFLEAGVFPSVILDHVLASGKNVKVLVLDTEVYSNTGGQASKSTPIGAIAKFAASGKVQAKKNLGLMQMQYKNVYVAYVSMAANTAATVKAFNEAEAYDGPAIIIAYAHCIEQGLNTATGPAHQIAAVDSVHFPLWRYDPRMAAQGKNGLTLDSKDKSDTVSFSANALSKDLGENRFRQLVKMVGADEAKALLDKAEAGFKENYKLLTELAALPVL